MKIIKPALRSLLTLIFGAATEKATGTVFIHSDVSITIDAPETIINNQKTSHFTPFEWSIKGLSLGATGMSVDYKVCDIGFKSFSNDENSLHIRKRAVSLKMEDVRADINEMKVAINKLLAFL